MKITNSDDRAIHARYPAELIDAFDALWPQLGFANRQDALRAAMRDFLKREGANQLALLAALKKIEKPLVAVALLLVLQAPAFAGEGVTIHDNGPYSNGAIQYGPVTIKERFSSKHPKLHWCGRKIRRTCQILNPIVQFVGSAAQIVTAVR